jgi:uncharacterized membrane protein YqgA involved in biofilm formation
MTTQCLVGASRWASTFQHGLPEDARCVLAFAYLDVGFLRICLFCSAGYPVTLHTVSIQMQERALMLVATPLSGCSA